MTAPRKPVAWQSPNGTVLDDELFQSRVNGLHDFGDLSGYKPLYTAPDLQPLWALVEKLEREASEADARASGFAAKHKYVDSDLWNEHASTKRKDASELRATLEAMQ